MCRVCASCAVLHQMQPPHSHVLRITKIVQPKKIRSKKKHTKEKYERNEIKSNENEREIMIEHDTDVFIVASFSWQQFYLDVMEVQKLCIQCSMFDVLYLRRL